MLWGIVIYKGDDLISKCISIKLNNYSTEIIILKKYINRIKVIDNINLDIGVKNLNNTKIKKEYIDLIIKKLNPYKKSRKIFFAMQNEDVIARVYKNLGKIRKKDIYGYIKFEIGQDMPVNLENYIVKYKILNKTKDTMDLQVILFPKDIEKICNEIAENIGIKRKYLNINFDIVQKLISKNQLNLNYDICAIIENLNNDIILNLMENQKIYTSNVFEKEGNADYILKFFDEDIHIFYYGIEDDFLNQIKEKGFKVDKLEINLKQTPLWTEQIVDKDINNYIIYIGLVMWMLKNSKCINIFDKNEKNLNLYQISTMIILLITLLQISINLIKYTQLNDYISKNKSLRQEEVNNSLNESNQNSDTQKCNINLSELEEVCSIIGMKKIKSIYSDSNQIEIKGVCNNTDILKKLSNQKNIKNFNIKSLQKEDKHYLFEIGGQIEN